MDRKRLTRSKKQYPNKALRVQVKHSKPKNKAINKGNASIIINRANYLELNF
jgi:hypothetical protein